MLSGRATTVTWVSSAQLAIWRHECWCYAWSDRASNALQEAVVRKEKRLAFCHNNEAFSHCHIMRHRRFALCIAVRPRPFAGASFRWLAGLQTLQRFVISIFPSEWVLCLQRLTTNVWSPIDLCCVNFTKFGQLILKKSSKLLPQDVTF